MTASGRKNADSQLLIGLAAGMTVARATEAAGVSESTAYRRMRTVGFQKQLADLKAEIRRRTVDQLTAAGVLAATTLTELLANKYPPAVRLSAARSVLEFAAKARGEAKIESRVRAQEAARQRASAGAYT